MVSQNLVAGTNGVIGTRNPPHPQPSVTLPSAQVLAKQSAKDAIKRDAIKRIYDTDARDIQKVGAANLNLNNLYCESLLKQADRSFWSALVAAVVGLVFFFGAAAFLMLSKQDTGQSVVISSLGTAIVACVSGTSFYLYRYTMGHFKAFHLCLARTEIVLLENSVCRQIEDVTRRDAAYASVVANMEKLIFLITASQSTTQDMVNNGKEEQDTGGNPD